MIVKSFLKQLHQRIHVISIKLGKETLLYLVEALLFSKMCRYEWFQQKYRSKALGEIQCFLDTTNILLKNPRLDPKEVIHDFLLYKYLNRHWNWGWHLDACRPEKLIKLIKVRGEEYFDNAYRQGNGVILAQYHTFAARMVFPWLEYIGVSPLLSIDNSGFDKLVQVQGGLDRINLSWARTLFAAKSCLKKGGVIRILPDGFLGSSGAIYDFYQRERPFRPAFAELSLETGAVVIPTSAITHQNGRFEITFHPPLDSGDVRQGRADRVDGLVRQYIKFLDGEWASAPGNISCFLMRQFMNCPSSLTKQQETLNNVG